MMFKVIKFFTDLHDNGHPYNVGDIFPRSGVTVSDARFAELAGSDNRQHTPLIEFVEEAPKEENPKEEKPKAAPKKAPGKRSKKAAAE